MITLHHLVFSRSTRIIWALEELAVPYELVVYQRTETFRAPPELAAIHSLGKAPILVDNGLTIAESGAILTHLNDRHGEGRLAPPQRSDARSIHDEWLHYAEGSAAMPIIMNLIGGMMGGLPAGIAQFVGPELDKTLGYIAGSLGEGPWLMGDQFTIADINLAYLVELSGSAGLLTGRPQLTEYLARFQARPAYRQAITRGGPVVPPRPA